VEERVFTGLVHGFLRWGGVVDAASELIGWLAGATRQSAGRAASRRIGSP
jgi:hypothetical protein